MSDNEKDKCMLIDVAILGTDTWSRKKQRSF